VSYSGALEAKARLISSKWDPTNQTREFGRIPFVDDMTDILSDAGTYWISPDLLQTITDASASLPKDMQFSRDLLPTKSGFIWLDGRLKLGTEATDYQDGVMAIVWDDGMIDLSAYPDLAPDEQLRHGVTIAILGRRNIGSSESAESGALGLSMSLSSWVYGHSLAKTYTDNIVYRDIADVAAYISDATIRETLDFFGAFCLFIRQRIATVTSERAERHARKRLDKAGWRGPDTVRVVQLRRRDQASRGRTHSGEPVEWSHRCVVGGHWHNFWMGPAWNPIKQPRWLLPYLKGPDNKPLKAPGAKVFAVVR
jgi:hypothetical protein